MQNRTLAPDLYHRASQRYIAHARTCRQTTSRNTLALSVQNTASGTRRTTLCAHTPIVTILERFPPRTLTCGLRFGEKLSILALQKPNRALREHCSFPISISKKGKGELGKKTKKDTLYSQRKYWSYIALITLKWKKKYKTFHRTFSAYTDIIKRHSTFMARDKRKKRDEFFNRHDRVAQQHKA